MNENNAQVTNFQKWDNGVAFFVRLPFRDYDQLTHLSKLNQNFKIWLGLHSADRTRNLFGSDAKAFGSSAGMSRWGRFLFLALTIWIEFFLVLAIWIVLWWWWLEIKFSSRVGPHVILAQFGKGSPGLSRFATNTTIHHMTSINHSLISTTI